MTVLKQTHTYKQKTVAILILQPKTVVISHIICQNIKIIINQKRKNKKLKTQWTGNNKEVERGHKTGHVTETFYI